MMIKVHNEKVIKPLVKQNLANGKQLFVIVLGYGLWSNINGIINLLRLVELHPVTADLIMTLNVPVVFNG